MTTVHCRGCAGAGRGCVRAGACRGSVSARARARARAGRGCMCAGARAGHHCRCASGSACAGCGCGCAGRTCSSITIVASALTLTGHDGT